MEKCRLQFHRVFRKAGCIFCWVLLIWTGFVSCQNGTNTTFTNPYINKLSFGTGADIPDFTLKGENDHFVYTPLLTIYWRVESFNEFLGTTLNFKIEKFDSNTNTYNFFDTYKNFGSLNGHIAISNFTQNYFLKGQYRLTVIRNDLNSSISSSRLVIQ